MTASEPPAGDAALDPTIGASLPERNKYLAASGFALFYALDDRSTRPP